jgi:hypothetical protein
MTERFGQMEVNMKIGNIALLVGLSIAAWASPSMAAVKNSATVTGRDAALAACNVEARKHYGGMYYNFDQARDFAYDHCMYDRGFTR